MTTPENSIRATVSNPGPSFRKVLVNRDFSLLWFGQLGSEVGNGAVQLALPWLVLDITGSALSLGVAYFFLFSPMLLFGVLGGVFVDRWDRRLTIVIVDAIRAVAFLSVALIYYLDGLTVEYLYAVLFLESTLANFFNPARAALLPSLVQEENLRAANSLMEVNRSIGFLIAPTTGAVVASALGPASILLIDGVTFAISGITVFFIKTRQPPREVQQSESWRHSVEIVVQQTKDGIGAIFRSRLLQVCMVLGFSLNLIVAPIQLLMPLFVRDVKHADVDYFGVLVGGLLVGLIIGSLGAPAAARRIGLGKMTIASVLILGTVISIAAWPSGLTIPVVAMAIAGTVIGALNVSQTTMLQSSTTDEERGRVSATYYTIAFGVRPFGFLALGLLASAVDIRLLFVFLGACALIVGVGLARLPEVREHV